MVFTIIAVFLVLVLIYLMYSLMQTSQHTSFVKKRLSKIVLDKEELIDEKNLSPLTDILSKKVEGLINRFIPRNITKELEKKIAMAKIKNFTVSQYFLLKIVIDLFLLIFVPLYFVVLKVNLNYGILTLLLIVGFIFPDLMLKSAIEKRHKQIFKELPNYIDLMRICVDAGMDLEGALAKIVENSGGIMQEETAQAVTEIRLGKSIPEALQDMAVRINFPDLSSFVTMLLQAAQMGISVSTVLKTQSYQINLKYVQEVRARASRIPVLILLPMVFFILPALMCVIIGPAIIQVMTVL